MKDVPEFYLSQLQNSLNQQYQENPNCEQSNEQFVSTTKAKLRSFNRTSFQEKQQEIRAQFSPKCKIPETHPKSDQQSEIEYRYWDEPLENCLITIKYIVKRNRDATINNKLTVTSSKK
ncbi:Hypothetical_protein [Hexamita inflata]|uniref:Hypothetical_protein n=1 Tax=Hexamita inflata TaxID=28002 RepID=A0AA86UCV1_9EUKA|nr:Hypothetical protein HINF_LOCUS33707 [Hexamita inflata]